MVLTQWAAALGAAVLAVVLTPAAPLASLPPRPAPPAETPADDTIEDGVYVLLFEGDGRKVKLTDGSDAVLGKKLSPSIGEAVRLWSWTNDNSGFTFQVRN